MENELSKTLEEAIDTHGMETVLETLAEICRLKANHILENWQDITTARHWVNLRARLRIIAAWMRRICPALLLCIMLTGCGIDCPSVPTAATPDGRPTASEPARPQAEPDLQTEPDPVHCPPAWTLDTETGTCKFDARYCEPCTRLWDVCRSGHPGAFGVDPCTGEPVTAFPWLPLDRR